MTQHTTKVRDHTSSAGVTLVEFLTVIAIIGIVAALPLMTMLRERHRATLEEGQATVLQVLNTTRSRALAGVAGETADGHVACIRTNTVEVFSATECTGDCSSCSGGTVYPLPPGITADEARVHFSRLRGASTDTTLNVSGFGETRTITVSDHGFVQ
jgi:prepilin-type N-terminal cleavage/methylation domain-containing protein